MRRSRLRNCADTQAAESENSSQMPYDYLREMWRKQTPEVAGWLRQAAIEWRRDPVIMRVQRPTRPDKARMMGYKAKQGIIVVRVRIRTGGARKPRPRSGRRQKAMGVTKFRRGLSLQVIAENRVKRRYPNMSLNNSYHLYSDGRNHWYEAVLVDKDHPANRS